MDPKHLLQQLIVGPINYCQRGETIVYGETTSRHLFVSAACKLLNELSKLRIRAAQWID